MLSALRKQFGIVALTRFASFLLILYTRQITGFGLSKGNNKQLHEKFNRETRYWSESIKFSKKLSRLVQCFTRIPYVWFFVYRLIHSTVTSSARGSASANKTIWLAGCLIDEYS